MENQHKLITGYRDLSQQEIDAMNKAKELANAVGAFCNSLAAMAKEDPTAIDPRWVAIGQTDLQKGFMALTRSIAKPTSF
jgi:hypothetical protein